MIDEQISKRPDVLATLIHIGNMFNTHRDFDKLLNTIIEETISILMADRASLFLLDEEKNEIWSKIATGLNKGDVIRQKKSKGIVGEVVTTGKALNIPDAYADHRFNREIDKITGYDTKTILCCPLTKYSGKTIGAFQVLNKKEGIFTEEDEKILSVLSSQACVAIENVQVYQASLKKHETLSSENILLKQQLKGKYTYPTIVGDSKQIQMVKRAIDRVATTSVNVLITGESGTGKELIAKSIHSKGPRSNQAFIPLNCASLPETLLESELFGIEKGIATGVSKRTGYFEQADKGTLFLDEVAEMSMAMQSKLLRALQEQSFLKVGGTREIHVDVRVISATNKNLKKNIMDGNFREDLFYRLNVFPIHMPGLRERINDLPILAKFILGNITEKMKLGHKPFTTESFKYMLAYDWPGNVRELENMIERAVIMSDDSEVDMAPIVSELIQIESGNSHPKGEGEFGEILQGREQPYFSIANMDMKQSVKTMEMEMITKALELTRGNQLKAAKKLGISREGLRKKIMRYEMFQDLAEA